MRYGFFIPVLLLPLAAIADDEAHPLPEVVVTAVEEGFTPAERIVSGHKVVYEEAEIQNSTAETLNDFLQQMGFAVLPSATAYSTTEVTLRGYDTGHHWNESSSRLLFLINGRRSGVNNIRQLALNNVERIEIIRGPEMLKYSVGSPGGIVNIVTKRGQGEALSGSVEVGGGSFNNKKGQLALHGASSGFDYSFSYMYESIGDYKDGRGKTVKNSRIDAINAFNTNLGYTLPDGNHRFGVEYYYYDVDDARRPRYWNAEEGRLEDPAVTDRRSQLGALTYEGSTSDKRFKWNVAFSVGQDKYYQMTDVRCERGEQYCQGNKIDTNQFKTGLDYTGDLVDVFVGADYIKYKTHNSAGPSQKFPIGSPMQLQNTTEIMGVSALATLKLLEKKLNLTGGLRWQHDRSKDNFTGDEPWWNPPGTPGFATSSPQWAWYGDNVYENMPTRRTYNSVSPTVGVTYLPVEWLKFRANYVRGFRAPSGRQLFASTQSEGYGTAGYPLLDAEKSDNYEIGFDINRTHANLSVSYFYSKHKNHMATRQIPNPAVPGGSLGNSVLGADERIQSGIEVGGSIDVAHYVGIKDFELRPYVNLVYMDKRRELFRHGFVGPVGEWQPITNQFAPLPDKTASFGLRFRHFNWGTTANLNFFYYGRVLSGSGNTSGIVFNPSSWANTYGKFTVASFSLTQPLYKFTGDKGLDLNLRVTNLLNKKYTYTHSPIAGTTVLHPGRSIYLGVAYKF
ncbi:MAG: TonB-dependent receptor [Betaproteobacteria bacterium]|nr:TonB-dependent receptor [Betaproteobacteria bacterium]